MALGRRALLFALWNILFFASLEGAAGWWLRGHGDALDLTRRILIADPDLGWRQRSWLATSFLGKPLQTNELGWRNPPLAGLPAQVGKILLLGPSSAFGWGVGEKETYAARLEGLLRAGRGNQIVINAGEIGFSSLQGLRMFDSPSIRDIRPAVLLIAYGVNDVDRHRFYFQSLYPDAEEFQRRHSPWALAAFRCLGESSLLSALYKLANFMRDPMAQVPVGPGVLPVPPLRVGPEAFVRNLHELAKAGRAAGAKVVFLGTPLLATRGRKISREEEASSARIFSAGEALYKEGRLAEAEGAFRKLAEGSELRNEADYYLSAIYRRIGKAEEAKRSFSQALAGEPARIRRDVDAYNELERKQAAAENAEYVDLDALFPLQGRAAYFVDPIHPSARGHARIAEEIGRRIFPD